MGAVRRVTEGTEGLSRAHGRVWGTKLQTLQTLRSSAPCKHALTFRRSTEGLEGLQVNAPHAREEPAQTLRNLPFAVAARWPA
jgi:hypothetical protein